MATFEDVRRIAMRMPEAEERTSRGSLQWRVKEKLFVWERPLRTSDLAALGDAAPDGPILGVRTESLAEKEALLQAEPDACFTTPHFDGYPAVLVQLDRVKPELLEELVVDAWVGRAPKRLADRFVEESGRSA